MPGLEDDEENALDELRMLEEEMHDMCAEPGVAPASTVLPCGGQGFRCTVQVGEGSGLWSSWPASRWVP